jgi:4-amino-4-deoxy-L-arabinose transferase-like glycosyltransferase
MTSSISLPSFASRRWLWLLVVCFLGYWLLRLPNLLALPVHTDEGEYVIWAQWVWGEHPLYFLEGGKVMTIFLTALLNPFNEGLFVARYLTVLLGAIGVAATYASARKLHSPQAGLLAALLWLGTPGLIFFERMNLHDIPLASMSMLTLWLTLRMAESPHWSRAVWAGIGLLLCVTAKGTGLVFLALPIIVLLFPPRRPRLPFSYRLQEVAVAYGIFVAGMVVPVAYLISVRADPLNMGINRPASLSSLGSPLVLIERVSTNLRAMIQAEYVYLSPALLIMLLVALLILIRRNARLAVMLMIITGVVLAAVAALASKLWLRYVTIATPYLLLITACGLAYLLIDRNAPRSRGIVWLVAVAYVLLVGTPYALTAQTSPDALPMPGTDRFEYVKWIASGYGIRDAAGYLRQTITQPTAIFSSAGNCYGAMTLLSSSLVNIRCPFGLTWWDSPNDDYVQSVHDHAEQYGFALVIADETAPIIAPDRLPQPLRVIKTFPRPDGEFNVILYCAGSADGDGCPSE